MKKKNFTGSLIGRQAEAKTKGFTHKGEVISESRNTITMQTEKGERTIIKSQAAISSDGIAIGILSQRKLEDRIKGE